VNGITKCLVDAFGRIATAVCCKVHQRRINGIEIVGQIHNFGDIVVAAIAVCDQSNTYVRCLLRRRHRGCDRPDLLFCCLDEISHAAGRIEHEDNIDFRVRRDVLRYRRFGRIGLHGLGRKLRVINDRGQC